MLIVLIHGAYAVTTLVFVALVAFKQVPLLTPFLVLADLPPNVLLRSKHIHKHGNIDFKFIILISL